MDAAESTDPEREAPPPDASGVRVVERVYTLEARRGREVIARLEADGMPDFLRRDDVRRMGEEGVTLHVYRISNGALYSVIENALLASANWIQTLGGYKQSANLRRRR